MTSDSYRPSRGEEYYRTHPDDAPSPRNVYTDEWCLVYPTAGMLKNGYEDVGRYHWYGYTTFWHTDPDNTAWSSLASVTRRALERMQK